MDRCEKCKRLISLPYTRVDIERYTRGGACAKKTRLLCAHCAKELLAWIDENPWQASAEAGVEAMGFRRAPEREE